MSTIPERVARGAALLDKRLPGWHERIDLDRLDLASGCDCVLGQAFDTRTKFLIRTNGYMVARAELLDDDEDEAARHGFRVDPDERSDALTAEWRKVILARLREGEAELAREQAVAALRAELEIPPPGDSAAAWHDTYQQHANAVDEFLGHLLELLPGAEDEGMDAYDQIPRAIKRLRTERDAYKRDMDKAQRQRDEARAEVERYRRGLPVEAQDYWYWRSRCERAEGELEEARVAVAEAQGLQDATETAWREACEDRDDAMRERDKAEARIRRLVAHNRAGDEGYKETELAAAERRAEAAAAERDQAREELDLQRAIARRDAEADL